jgi:uncharacterized membrane protein YhaH (DUF805 family)
MTLREAIAALYRGNADFAGRSSRDEAGWGVAFVLAVLLGVLGPVLWLLFPQAFGRPDTGGAQGLRLAAGEVVGALAFWAIFTVKPLVALLVRRMHDLDRPGALALAGLIPGLGQVLLLVWLCQRGSPGLNRFGPPPEAAPGVRSTGDPQ